MLKAGIIDDERDSRQIPGEYIATYPRRKGLRVW